MQEFKITGIGIDTRTDNPLIILHSLESDLILPIWIGRLEAHSIAIALQEEKVERPLTHDLIINCLEKFGFKLDRTIIHSVIDSIFYADLVFKNLITGEEILLDARPSDCIALAVRANCSVLVSALVIEESCIPAIIQIEDPNESENDKTETKKEKEAFQRFLDNVKASDFKLSSDGKEN